MSKSPTIFQGGQQSSQFIYGKQMGNGSNTSPSNQEMSAGVSFIPNQRGSPPQYMGYTSPMQGHPQNSQNFMMQPHHNFGFNPVSSYNHMGLQSQHFTPNLSTLLG
jgi:hypothetical protein